MKKLFFFLLIGLTVAFISCHPESNDYSGNKLLLVQLTYLTKQPKGIKEIFFSTSDHSIDTLPIQIQETNIGDLIDLNFTHTLTGDPVFKGLIIWAGSGYRSFPASMDSPSDFSTTTPIPKPDNSQFKILYPDSALLASSTNITIPYNQIWGSVCTYNKVKYYMDNNCKIGLFLYTPSVGVGDPSEWEWYILFYL